MLCVGPEKCRVPCVCGDVSLSDVNRLLFEKLVWACVATHSEGQTGASLRLRIRVESNAATCVAQQLVDFT
jgi:hypothetical protein